MDIGKEKDFKFLTNRAHQKIFIFKFYFSTLKKPLSKFNVLYFSERQISIFYTIKELVLPKMSLNNGEFLIWKERGATGQISRQAY